MDNGSIGTVQTKYADLCEPLGLEGGGTLAPLRIAYETYGRLNKERSNAILICHALSGDAHAAGFHSGDAKPGWWDNAIGPGKGFDTNKYFVICSNIIGGCRGSTGPSSTDPRTGEPYGTSFPVITIQDMVNAQKMLVDHLGLTHLFAVAGGSMGGMQVLQWIVSYPDLVRKAIIIATTAYSTPQQIAFNAVGRKAITSDPNWNGGDYYGREIPSHGLSLARMIGHITYLSNDSMHAKFGRNLQNKDKVGFDFSTDFQVESYLNHQGDTFVKRFDANSYLYITKAIDYFGLTKDSSLIKGLAGVRATVLVVGVTSDWLYPPYQSQEIVSALSANEVKVHYGEIRSNYGHDAFLIEGGQLNYLVRSFLNHTLVRDVMSSNVPTILEGTTIDAAARLMIKKEVNHLPVMSSHGKIVGIVTSWDIAKAVACGHRELREIVSTPVHTIRGDASIEDAIEEMEEHHISALPVVDMDKRVTGLISADSVSMLVGRYK